MIQRRLKKRNQQIAQVNPSKIVAKHCRKRTACPFYPTKHARNPKTNTIPNMRLIQNPQTQFENLVLPMEYFFPQQRACLIKIEVAVTAINVHVEILEYLIPTNRSIPEPGPPEANHPLLSHH